MRRLFLLFLCLFIAGCAATNKGSYQEIIINSNVAGALVEIDGVEVGKTPFRGKIKRDGVDKVKVKVKTDYAFSDIQLEKRGGIFIGADAKGLAITTEGSGGAAIITLGFAAVAGITVASFSVFGASLGDTGGGDLACVSSNVICAIVVASCVAFMVYMTYEPLSYSYKDKSMSDIAADLSSTTKKAILGAAWEYSPSQYYVEFQQEGDSGMDFINNIAIRYFTTVNHSQIAIDAGNDGGEYVDALADFMKAKKDRDIARRDINEALEESKGDQVAFGDALVARFRK